jgi:hypothetical protein
VSFGCVASAPLAVARCTSSVANGTTIPTSSLGLHSLTVTAVDSNGIASVRTVRYTVVAVRPTITGLRQSAAVWLEHRRGRNGGPVGTKFSFSLDQAAGVTFRFVSSASGRTTGTLTVAERAGNDTLSFSGTTSRGALAPGTYTVLVSAIGVGGQPSTIRSLRFVVASPTGR